MPDWGEKFQSIAPADASSTRPARDIFLDAMLNAPSERLPGKKNKDDWRFLDSLGIDPYQSQAVHDITLDQMLAVQGIGSAFGAAKAVAGGAFKAGGERLLEIAKGAIEKQKPALASRTMKTAGQTELFPQTITMMRADIEPTLKAGIMDARDYMRTIYSSPEARQHLSDAIVGIGKKYRISDEATNAGVGRTMAGMLSKRLDEISKTITVDPALGEDVAARFQIPTREISINPNRYAEILAEEGEQNARFMVAKDVTHEMTHGYDSMIPEMLTGRIGPAYSNFMEEEIAKIASVPTEPTQAILASSDVPGTIAYMNDPNEIYAHLSELRYALAQKYGATPATHYFESPEVIGALGRMGKSPLMNTELGYLYNRVGGVEGLRKLAKLLPAAAPATLLSGGEDQ